MIYVTAILAICLASDPAICPLERQARIEPRACHTAVHGQIEIDGQWTDVVITARCTVSK